MLIGVHGDNRPQWPEESFRLLRLCQPQLIKVLSGVDPTVVDRLRQEHPEALIVVRLFWPGRPPDPRGFVERKAREIGPLLERGCVWYELLNEPNTPWEGWGPERADALAFEAWALEAVALLRERFPSLKLLWPALAVNPEFQAQTWWDACRGSILACDALAVHGYWQPEEAMLSEAWGLHFLRAKRRYPFKGLWLTEAGCTDPRVNRAQRARLYPRYALRCRELGVQGIAFWLLSGSEEWAVAQGASFDEGLARAIGAIPRLTTDAASQQPVSPTTEARPMGEHPEQHVRSFAPLIQSLARKRGVPASLLAAVMLVESGGNPHVESPMNYAADGRPLGRAQGLMQVMPFHWGLPLDAEGELSPGDKAFAQDPERNVDKGAEVLRRGYERWGSWRQAVAAYFGALDAQGQVTGARDATGTTGQRYVELILAAQERFRDLDEEGPTSQQLAAHALDIWWGHWGRVQAIANRLRDLEHGALADELEALVADSRSHFATVKRALGLE
jgi:soluble lytic murein transglycosylase-like protein